MKHYLLASAFLVLACNCPSVGQTAPAKPATKSPAAAPAALPGKDLNLTPYGIPLIMRVPDGTTAAKDKNGGATVTGPKFEININTMPEDMNKPPQIMERLKGVLQPAQITQMLVDEPLALYAYKKGDAHSYTWFVLVPQAATNKVYSLSMPLKMNMPDATYTKADYDRMFAYARAAKLTGK